MIRRSQEGFTLMELVIILVILGAIAFIMIVWPQNQSVEISAQIHHLQNTLRYAQQQANIRQERIRVNFQSNGYSITDRTGSTAILPPAQTSNSTILPSGIRLRTRNLPNGYMVFDAHGTPYTDSAIPGTALANNARITLTDGNISQFIVVRPDTGHTAIR